MKREIGGARAGLPSKSLATMNTMAMKSKSSRNWNSLPPEHTHSDHAYIMVLVNVWHLQVITRDSIIRPHTAAAVCQKPLYLVHFNNTAIVVVKNAKPLFLSFWSVANHHVYTVHGHTHTHSVNLQKRWKAHSIVRCCLVGQSDHFFREAIYWLPLSFFFSLLHYLLKVFSVFCCCQAHSVLCLFNWCLHQKHQHHTY